MLRVILWNMHSVLPILLSPEEQMTLTAWARAKSLPVRLVQRARIISMAAKGVPNQDIARHLAISRPTVQLWRERFLALRIAGLEKDAPRPGRIPNIPEGKVRAVVEATLKTKPATATHWSVRSMAKLQGISPMSVQRIWTQHGLKPRLIRTFDVRRDKEFSEELYDVAGLYLNPPNKSLVLSVDQNNQVRALDRTRPGGPLKKARRATRTQEDTRNGITALFSAMSMLEGKVIGNCMLRHQHLGFIRFLKMIDANTPSHLNLHLIVDDNETHKHPRVKAWLQRHARFQVHVIPTSNPWLKMVERRCRNLTGQRIRRGSFRNVRKLIAAIKEYVDHHKYNPRVFTWTAPLDGILTKTAQNKDALEKPH